MKIRGGWHTAPDTPGKLVFQTRQQLFLFPIPRSPGEVSDYQNLHALKLRKTAVSVTIVPDRRMISCFPNLDPYGSGYC